VCAVFGRQKGDSDFELPSGNASDWWFFWIFLWTGFFFMVMPLGRTTYWQMQSPLQPPQRRCATEEIASEEYEEWRTKLLRDTSVK